MQYNRSAEDQRQVDAHQSGITIGGSGGVRSRFARRGYPQPAVAEGHALNAAIANSMDSANTEAALRESAVAGPQARTQTASWFCVHENHNQQYSAAHLQAQFA